MWQAEQRRRKYERRQAGHDQCVWPGLADSLLAWQLGQGIATIPGSMPAWWHSIHDARPAIYGPLSLPNNCPWPARR